jgi:hypothetical protein
VVELNLSFASRLSRNSGSPEYHFGRKLSQLSDVPLSGSKQLAIYVLRLSELDRVAESGILDRPCLSAYVGISTKFSPDLPEILNTEVVSNEVFPLVMHTVSSDERFDS